MTRKSGRRSREGRRIEPGACDGEATRIACVEIPALPLQLLLMQQPRWRRHPVAVVDEDSPRGRLLFVNDAARAHRVLPGMRYAAARSLVATLRARTVDALRCEQAVGELFAHLHDYSPRVEPAPELVGRFFLDPGGLGRLYGDLEQWSRHLLASLRARGFEAVVVVGFHRFRTQAITRIVRGSCVLPSARREASMAATVPLEGLGLSPRLRDELAALDVRTLGDFMSLPAGELRLRYGEEAERLHQRATASSWDPLLPRELVEAIRRRVEFEPPESNHERLLFRLKSPLDALLERLGEGAKAMSALRLEFALDHAGIHREQLEPAAPTLDLMQILELIRLRLASARFTAAIEAVTIDVEGVDADHRQLQLFTMRKRRDLEAGGRAIARIRALFGPQSVTVARITPAHLPEASFTWEPTTKLRHPRLDRPPDMPFMSPAASHTGVSPGASRTGEAPPLIRRIFPRPIPLPGPSRVRQEGWTLPRYGTIEALHGPFRVSGGWWARTVERDYHYAETREGWILWIYYDRPRRRWFLHGEVD